MEFNKRLDEWINIDRVDFSREAVKDEVATVRETTVACFPALFEAVHNDDTLFKEAIKRVCEFSSENKFRSRVIFVQICYALVLSGFPKLDFERYFLPILENFSADSVVNQYYQDPISRPPQILGMINRLAEDPDFEVRSFLFMILSPEERLKP
ncbi:12413_t:CDS:2 [Entrophospora sp. SA101]|nr:12413_t:CDS:2 [Entrophospora sp. SA101]